MSEACVCVCAKRMKDEESPPPLPQGVTTSTTLVVRSTGHAQHAGTAGTTAIWKKRPFTTGVWGMHQTGRTGRKNNGKTKKHKWGKTTIAIVGTIVHSHLYQMNKIGQAEIDNSVKTELESTTRGVQNDHQLGEEIKSYIAESAEWSRHEQIAKSDTNKMNTDPRKLYKAS